MNKEQIWLGFLEQAPKAVDPEFVIKLRSRGLKALLDQAYDEGFEQGKKADTSLFDNVFGKLRK